MFLRDVVTVASVVVVGSSCCGSVAIARAVGALLMSSLVLLWTTVAPKRPAKTRGPCRKSGYRELLTQSLAMQQKLLEHDDSCDCLRFKSVASGSHMCVHFMI